MALRVLNWWSGTDGSLSAQKPIIARPLGPEARPVMDRNRVNWEQDTGFCV